MGREAYDNALRNQRGQFTNKRGEAVNLTDVMIRVLNRMLPPANPDTKE